MGGPPPQPFVALDVREEAAFAAAPILPGELTVSVFVSMAFAID